MTDVSDQHTNLLYDLSVVPKHRFELQFTDYKAVVLTLIRLWRGLDNRI